MNNKSNIILVFDRSCNAKFEIGYAFEVQWYCSFSFDTCKNYDPLTIEKCLIWWKCLIECEPFKNISSIA